MKRAVSTPNAPEVIGPYSQAVRAGRWLFLSGQIPIDPLTAEIVHGDAEAQAERVLQNLSAVLAESRCGPADVVRTTIYLVDLADFARVNQAYARFFPAPHPARSTVQVVALPRGARVEIDAIALVPGVARLRKKRSRTRP
jgi:2-iminobutanoate/2-iminopropanoate deaminase